MKLKITIDVGFSLWNKSTPMLPYRLAIVPRYFYTIYQSGANGTKTLFKMRVIKSFIFSVLLISCKHEYVVVLEKVTNEQGHGYQVIQDIITERSDNDACSVNL